MDAHENDDQEDARVDGSPCVEKMDGFQVGAEVPQGAVKDRHAAYPGAEEICDEPLDG